VRCVSEAVTNASGNAEESIHVAKARLGGVVDAQVIVVLALS